MNSSRLHGSTSGGWLPWVEGELRRLVAARASDSAFIRHIARPTLDHRHASLATLRLPTHEYIAPVPAGRRECFFMAVDLPHGFHAPFVESFTCGNLRGGVHRWWSCVRRGTRRLHGMTPTNRSILRELRDFHEQMNLPQSASVFFSDVTTTSSQVRLPHGLRAFPGSCQPLPCPRV